MTNEEDRLHPALTPTEAVHSPTDPALQETIASGSSGSGTPSRMDGIPPEGRPDSLPGYTVASLLGRGGMGEVVLARDGRIGREVAVKRLHTQTPSEEVVRHFLREARIQARLEHPAIVPVYELGHDPQGRPFFSMKRLAGVTLLEILVRPDPPPRQRLLRVFADICAAVEFAHSRGVVHCDLKPANVMLGDFGEVYVLDWGLARVLDDRESPIAISDLGASEGLPQAGAAFGTPGYMAPEQVRGAPEIGRAADVYGLGSILFEILASEPAHPRGPTSLVSTLAGVSGTPAQRRPDRDVPPELDEVCAAALALDAALRPTVAQLAERVQRYLDGDRDVERRRELAAGQLELARSALAADPVNRFAEAIQAAGRALSLDPQSRDAAELVTRLILEPPAEHPPELRAELVGSEVAVQRRQARIAMFSFGAVFAFLAMAAWNGIDHWMLLLLICAFTLVMVTAAFTLSRRAASRSEMLAVALGNACLAALLSRTFGPLIVVPGVICIMALSLTSYPQLIDRARFVIAGLVASWLVPVALEWADVLSPTWRVGAGEVTSRSSLIEIGGAPTSALLIVSHLVMIIVIGLFASALATSRRNAQRQLEIQAWHLRQLLPGRKHVDTLPDGSTAVPRPAGMIPS